MRIKKKRKVRHLVIALFVWPVVFCALYMLQSDDDYTDVSDYLIDSTGNLTGCVCKNTLTFAYHNFCYKNIINKTEIIGKPFHFACKLIDKIEKLEIFNEQPEYYQEQSTFSMHETNVSFISAFSSNHFDEGMDMIAHLQILYESHANIIVYDLGLSEYQITLLKKTCQVEYRKFDFDKWPTIIQNLDQYRWKPIIIAEALFEFGAIWWLDTSIKFLKKDLSAVYDQISCQNGDRAINKCNKFVKFPWLLFDMSGHSIYSGTHEDTLNFLPMHNQTKNVEATQFYEMFGAGLMLLLRTKEVAQNILKWWVLCAVEPTCMAPNKSRSKCTFGSGDRFKSPPNCHRFDQSALNILLANKYQTNKLKYFGKYQDFYEVDRNGDDLTPEICDVDNSVVQDQVFTSGF